MSDINQMLKVNLKADGQKSTALKVKAKKKIKIIENPLSKNALFTLSNEYFQEQVPNRMETIDSISSKNQDDNIYQLKVQSNGAQNNFNLPHSADQIGQDRQKQQKNEVTTKYDLFQKMLEEERKQEGAIVVKFGNQIQIQPKFMKIRGSMCSTELWSMKQKKELCSEYIRNSQLEKGKDQTSTFKKNGLVLSGVNNSSPFEYNQIIDSRKFRMPMSDRTSGISYFKPEKMINQADMYIHLKSHKQGVVLKKQSTIQMIENTINPKLPLDLKFWSVNGQPPQYSQQTASSSRKSIQLFQTNKVKLNSPKQASVRTELSPQGSPHGLSDTTTFSTQVKLLSNFSSKRNSFLKSPQLLQSPLHKDVVKDQEIGDSFKKRRSPQSLQLPIEIFNNNLSPFDLNSSFSSKKNFPLTDRTSKAQNQSSSSRLNDSLFSTKNKPSRLSLKSPIILPSINDFDSPAFTSQSQQSQQLKNSMDTLINKCNNSLIDSIQLQQDQDKIKQQAEQWTKKIERKEKELFSS